MLESFHLQHGTGTSSLLAWVVLLLEDALQSSEREPLLALLEMMEESLCAVGCECAVETTVLTSRRFAPSRRALLGEYCGTVADTPLSPTSTSASPQFTTARERNRAEVVALLERAGEKVSPSPALCVELGQREDEQGLP